MHIYTVKEYNEKMFGNLQWKLKSLTPWILHTKKTPVMSMFIEGLPLYLINNKLVFSSNANKKVQFPVRQPGMVSAVTFEKLRDDIS